MTEEKQASKSTSVIQSMLNKLKSNERVQPSGLHSSQFYTKDIDQSECEVAGDSHKLESTFAGRDHSDITIKPHSFESTLENAAGEDSGTFTLETDLHKSSPVIFSNWQRRKHAFNHLTKGVEEDLQCSKSQHERGEVKEESGLKEETSGAESRFDCVKDRPMQEESEALALGPKKELLTPGPSSGSIVSKMEPAVAALNPPQSNKSLLTFYREGKTKAPGPSNKDAHTAKQGLDTTSSKTFVYPDSRATRTVSDPVRKNTRSGRTFSDPSGHYMEDMDQLTMHLDQANLITEQPSLVKAGTPETTEFDGSGTKIQEKVKKDKKMKNIAQKLIARFKEKNSQEGSSSSSSHHSDEEAAQTGIYMEEAKSPMRVQKSPPLSPTEGDFTMINLRLQRTFTLRDFTFNLEPINLLEEVFTGEEWTKFLPVKESLLQEEANDQSQTESSCQSDDVQPHHSVITLDLSTDKEQSQSELDQASISDSALDEVSESQTRQRRSNSIIFAVPKALITNGAVKHRKSELPQHEPSIYDDVYDFVEVYMLPKDNRNRSKVKDPPLDLSEVKSTGLLDNSALKSRIHLSKKRMHRPPKKRRKEKTGMARTSVFYTSITSMDVPQQCSASTTSSSPQSVTTSTSPPFTRSVFYALPNQKPSCDTEVSPAPADEKQKAKERSEKPKLWKLKN